MPLHYHTPLLEYRGQQQAGKTYLKMECFQPAGSFKIRGIGLLCSQAAEDGVRHFVSSSGGNAGLAVAYAGRQLGAAVTVVVPETTSATARDRIRSEGAEIIVHGNVWDEANHYSLQLAAEKSALHVHPFDHPLLWQGHSTIIDELVHDGCKPDTIVLSTGGGGLLSGVVEGLNRHGWDDVTVVAVETAGAESLAASLAAGKLATLDKITSIAGTLGARQVAERAFEVMQGPRRTSVVVTDQAACQACVRFAEDFRVLVEPACGATLSLLYNEFLNNPVLIPENCSNGEVLFIVCGGVGVNLNDIIRWQDL